MGESPAYVLKFGMGKTEHKFGTGSEQESGGETGQELVKGPKRRSERKREPVVFTPEHFPEADMPKEEDPDKEMRETFGDNNCLYSYAFVPEKEKCLEIFKDVRYCGDNIYISKVKSSFGLPQYIRFGLFMAVCIRFRESNPSLFLKKLVSSGIDQKILDPFVSYLKTNHEALKQHHTVQLRAVDKHFRFKRGEKGEILEVSVPENVNYFLEYSDWRGFHGSDIPSGPSFIEYLEREFRESVDNFFAEVGEGKPRKDKGGKKGKDGDHVPVQSDEEKQAERERVFYTMQERLYRLQLECQDRYDKRESRWGARWGTKQIYAPQSHLLAETFNWHARETRGEEYDEFLKLLADFARVWNDPCKLKERLIAGFCGHPHTIHILVPFYKEFERAEEDQKLLTDGEGVKTEDDEDMDTDEWDDGLDEDEENDDGGAEEIVEGMIVPDDSRDDGIEEEIIEVEVPGAIPEEGDEIYDDEEDPDPGDDDRHFFYGMRGDSGHFLKGGFNRDCIEQIPAAKELYLKSLDTTHVLRKGSIIPEEVSSDNFQFRLPIRRRARPSIQNVCRGLFCYNYAPDEEDHYEGYYNAYPTPSFYTRDLGPQLRRLQPSDPFEWALKGTQITAGLMTHVHLEWEYPYPLHHLQYQFMKMAGHVCNTTPENLVGPREIRMDPNRRKLLETMREKLGEAFTIEMAWFVVKNSGFLPAKIFNNKKLLELFGKTPLCFENGLVVDRLDDLFLMHVGKGWPGDRALQMALELVTDIFGSGKEPWWFKEDFDMTTCFDPELRECRVEDEVLRIGYCEEGRNLISKIAKGAGFAFTHALELYKVVGYKLMAVPGAKQKEFFDFFCSMVMAYGIGHTGRAKNVIEFAIAQVMEVPLERRTDSLKLFRKFAEQRSPFSEIIGAMEGEECTFYMPGFLNLASTCLGREAATKMGGDGTKLDDMTLGPAVFKQLAEGPLAAPLKDRIKLLPPALKRGERGNYVPEHRLLMAGAAADVLMLPLPEGSAGNLPALFKETPVNSIFEFYQQVEEECGGVEGNFIREYFALYAVKFPNPFKPPKGFLKFLMKFKAIPNPEGLEAFNRRFAKTYDWAERGPTMDETKAVINRKLIISNLLDAHAMGLLAWEELDVIFRWMTADLPKERVEGFREIAVEEKDRNVELRVKRFAERIKAREERARKIAELGDSWEGRKLIEEDKQDDRNDRDVLPMTPEEEEQYIQDRIHEHARKEGEDMRVKRVRIVENAVNFVAAINILVTLKLIRPEDFRQLVSEHLKVMPMMEDMDTEFFKDESAFPLLSDEAFKDTVAILHKLSKMGVMDVGSFQENLSGEVSLDKKYETIKEFFFCVSAYRKSMEIMRHSKENFRSDMNFIYHSAPEGARKRLKNLAKEVRQMDDNLCVAWSVSPLIAKKVVDALATEAIQSMFTKEQYPDVFSTMEELVKLEVYDPEGFQKRYNDQTTPAKKVRVLGELFLCTVALRESKKAVKAFEGQLMLSTGSRWGNSSERTIQTVPQLMKTLDGYWEGISCVNPAITIFLMQELLPVAHYMSILSIIRQTRAEALAKVEARQEEEKSEGSAKGEEGKKSETGESSAEGVWAAKAKEFVAQGGDPVLAKNVRRLSAASFDAFAAVLIGEFMERRTEYIQRQIASASHLLLTDGATPQDVLEVFEPAQTVTLTRFDDYSPDKVKDIFEQSTPRINSMLRMHRKESLGLVTVGGKIHIKNFNHEKLRTIREFLGLSSTQFRLQYVDDSLILPASMTPAELKSFIALLVKFGVVDEDHLQLQVTAPGRLNPIDCSILGSAILLATKRGREYSKDSFLTTDASTGARMMLYDADPSATTQLPFIKGLKGRTDMLGRLSPDDIDLYQLLHTVLIHEQHKGPFGKFAREFKMRYIRILKRYEIDDVINDNWIYGNRRTVEGAEDHYNTVKRVTNSYFTCVEKFKETGERKGIIFEVRDLFKWLRAEVKQAQEELLINESTRLEAELALCA